MKEVSVGKTEYHVKKFMYALGIKNSVLAVYAALYSFTVGERGLYHGSAGYLAASLGISVRTLRRAYKLLFERGLIERYATEDGRYVGIRCVSLEASEDSGARAFSGESESVERPAGASAFGTETATVSADGLCARILGKMYKEGAPEHERNTFLMMHKYEKHGDNRRFMSFGKSGGVIMTEPQYRRLLDLLPTEELMPYLVKLEAMLNENVKTGKKPPHSHYKTIKKWIEEDVAL